MPTNTPGADLIRSQLPEQKAPSYGPGDFLKDVKDYLLEGSGLEGPSSSPAIDFAKRELVGRVWGDTQEERQASVAKAKSYGANPAAIAVIEGVRNLWQSGDADRKQIESIYGKTHLSDEDIKRVMPAMLNTVLGSGLGGADIMKVDAVKKYAGEAKGIFQELAATKAYAAKQTGESAWALTESAQMEKQQLGENLRNVVRNVRGLPQELLDKTGNVGWMNDPERLGTYQISKDKVSFSRAPGAEMSPGITTHEFAHADFVKQWEAKYPARPIPPAFAEAHAYELTDMVDKLYPNLSKEHPMTVDEYNMLSKQAMSNVLGRFGNRPYDVQMEDVLGYYRIR